MRLKGLILIVGVLAASSLALGDIPTRWDGNNYPGTGGGFRRIAWVQWPDPVFPAIMREYRNDRNSFRFTSAVSGTMAALQLHNCTTVNKHGYLDPMVTASIQTDDGSGKPSGTIVGSSAQITIASDYSGLMTFPVSASLTAGATWTEQQARDISFGLDIVIPGDANGDHWVNVGDLGILAAHYGEHLPEPTTMGLLVFGSLVLIRRRRR